MNEDLKPSKAFEKIDDIWIEDPTGSRLHQWKNIELKKGLAQVDPYKLPEEPNLGKWTIKAEMSKRESP